jgi:hypothetical protein
LEAKHHIENPFAVPFYPFIFGEAGIDFLAKIESQQLSAVPVF